MTAALRGRSKSALRFTFALGIVTLLGAQAPAPGTVHRVTMTAAHYEPRQIKVRLGDSIEWVNKDIVAHTATLKGSWDVNVLPGRAGRITLKTAGTMAYICRYHPNMRGVIVVEP